MPDKPSDTLTFRYGQETLTLEKSDTLVGIRAHGGSNGRFMDGFVTTPAADYALLGGFELHSVPPEGMEATLDGLRLHPAVKTGTHVYYSSDDGVPFVPTGEIYLVFKEGVPLDEAQGLLETHGLELLEARTERELITRVTRASLNPLKVVQALQASSLVAIAEPELATPAKLHAFCLPTDPLLERQWHLENTGFHRGTSLGFLPGADARVVAAWRTAETLGSPDVVVAVIDDGFDLSHPDLSGEEKIVAPWDFTRNNNRPLPQPELLDWHGTACAGVAIGSANDSGILGAAPDSRFMPVRWGQSLADRQLEAWFDYVREEGAWVVSCSWGAFARFFPLSSRAHRAIARCAKEGRGGRGSVVVFAAGNESRDINNASARSLNGFATHPDVIAVSASNSRDRASHYSNYGSTISLCAPSSGAGGWGITTADVGGEYTDGERTREAGYSPGLYTDDFGGTSSSAPLVAGVAALLFALDPTLTALELRRLMETTARRIGILGQYDAETGHSPVFGYGCVNAEAAVAQLLREREGRLERA